MFKKFKGLLIGLLVVLIIAVPAYAAKLTPGGGGLSPVGQTFWNLISGALIPNGSYDLGSTSQRIQKLWVDEFDCSGTGCSAGGGASTYVELNDTPGNYTGAAGKCAVVNGSATGMTFTDCSAATGTGSFAQNFTDADLVAGVLTIQHNLGDEFPSVTIYNDSLNIIIPDEVTSSGGLITNVDLSAFGTISGTWRARVLSQGGSATELALHSDNTVFVKSESDLPAAVGGFITMETGKHYIFADNFELTNGLKIAPLGSNKISFDNHIESIHYSGVEAVLSGTGFTQLVIDGVLFTNSGTSVTFNLSSSVANSIVRLRDSTFVGFDQGGTLEEIDFVSGVAVAFLNYDDGITHKNIGNHSWIGSAFTPPTASTGSVFYFEGVNEAVSFIGNKFETAPGRFVFTIASDSTMGIGIVSNNPWENTGTFFNPSGLDQSAAGWIFSGNGNAVDSSFVGAISLGTTNDKNSTGTTINTQDVYVPVSGSTTFDGQSERFTGTGDNILIYKGQKDIKASIFLSLSAIKGSGPVNTYQFTVFKNGTIIDERYWGEAAVTTDAVSIATEIPIVNISTNDYFEAYARNITGDQDITVERMVFRIKKL